jgi:thiol-disulfide isomerase/thioredoxin
MKKNKIKSLLIEFLKLFVILTIVLNIVSYYKSSDLNKEQLNLSSFSLVDGSEFTIEKDKPILIHFWATWCPICKLEAPNIKTISKDYQVITIATQSGNDTELLQYIQKNNLNFKVMNDESGYYANSFNIKGYPTTLIYDKDGNHKFSEAGYTSTLGLYVRMFLAQY